MKEPTTALAQNTINLHSTPTVVIASMQASPNILVRLLWFVVLGWWLGMWAIAIGYALCVLVVTLPVGLAVLNRLPQIMTLRAPSARLDVRTHGGATVVAMGGARQYPFLLRAVYFLCIGLWITLPWVVIAWIAMVFWWATFGLSLAISFWMVDRIPAVLTLRRN